ncbi:MAG: Bax inhibitor-1/YccA family protein [Chthoniobacterales bacterium]|jgi:FtsH-binding integral membrane protein
MTNPYTVPVADLAAREQSSFLTRVYAHLVLAILLFVGLEVWFFRSGVANSVLQIFSGVSWLVVLGGFMLLSWLATLIAVPTVARPLQYVGFALYVLLQALIFIPLLAAADSVAPGVIGSAAQVTIGGFLLLTAVVVTTGKDFSFLRSFLVWGGLFGLALIVAAVLFGFDLGTWFSVAMIVLAGGSVLYTTSNIMRGFPAGADVAAAMQLFAGIAMMFWYVLRLFMASRR